MIRPFLIAAVPVALTVYYFVWVAPDLVPVSTEVTVPFRPATRFLEDVAVWCGEHARAVLITAIVVMIPGLFYKRVDRAERYYLRVAVVVSVVLVFAYLSLSAPIDRLMHTVEEDIPQDRRVPDHTGARDR